VVPLSAIMLGFAKTAILRESETPFLGPKIGVYRCSRLALFAKITILAESEALFLRALKKGVPLQPFVWFNKN
jgi:hypothetical protein